MGRVALAVAGALVVLLLGASAFAYGMAFVLMVR